jgi:hypothetical protein
MQPTDPLRPSSSSKQKECPFCKEQVQADAIVCRHCLFDTTAKYEPCGHCGELIKQVATLCRFCNTRKAPPVEKIVVAGPKNKQILKVEQRAGLYGEGVRGQVFEVIVRQGMAGAPWRAICAGPMKINNISADEVEAEIRRRQNLLS